MIPPRRVSATKKRLPSGDGTTTGYGSSRYRPVARSSTYELRSSGPLPADFGVARAYAAATTRGVADSAVGVGGPADGVGPIGTGLPSGRSTSGTATATAST